jgi:hypothetical protein
LHRAAWSHITPRRSAAGGEPDRDITQGPHTLPRQHGSERGASRPSAAPTCYTATIRCCGLPPEESGNHPPRARATLGRPNQGGASMRPPPRTGSIAAAALRRLRRSAHHQPLILATSANQGGLPRSAHHGRDEPEGRVPLLTGNVALTEPTHFLQCGSRASMLKRDNALGISCGQVRAP